MIIFFIQNLLGNFFGNFSQASQEILQKNFEKWKEQEEEDRATLTEQALRQFNELSQKVLFKISKKNSFFYVLNQALMNQCYGDTIMPIFFNFHMIDIQEKCFMIDVELFLELIINEIFAKSSEIHFNFFCQKNLEDLNKKYITFMNQKTKILINPINNARFIFIKPEKDNNLYLDYMNLYVKFYKDKDKIERHKIESLFFYYFLNMIQKKTIVYTQGIDNFESFFYLVLQKYNRSLKSQNISNQSFVLSQELIPFFQVESIITKTSEK